MIPTYRKNISKIAGASYFRKTIFIMAIFLVSCSPPNDAKSHQKIATFQAPDRSDSSAVFPKPPQKKNDLANQPGAEPLPTTIDLNPQPTRGPVLTACPKKLDVKQIGASCAFDSRRECTFKKGVCSCSAQTTCSGASERLMRKRRQEKIRNIAIPSTYECEISDANVLREDGCSFVVPKNGSSCSISDKRCLYQFGKCGGRLVSATCKQDHWEIVTTHIAPPP